MVATRKYRFCRFALDELVSNHKFLEKFSNYLAKKNKFFEFDSKLLYSFFYTSATWENLYENENYFEQSHLMQIAKLQNIVGKCFFLQKKNKAINNKVVLKIK